MNYITKLLKKYTMDPEIQKLSIIVNRLINILLKVNMSKKMNKNKKKKKKKDMIIILIFFTYYLIFIITDLLRR